MSHRTTSLLGRFRSTNPDDLVVGIAAMLGLDFLLMTIGLDNFARTLLALPVLLFLPGYFVLAALFPRQSVAGDAHPLFAAATGRDELDVTERLVLSYGVSLALLPLLGLVLSETQWGFTTTSVLAGVTAIVLGCAPVAIGRRLAVPRDERFQFPFRDIVTDLTAGVTGSGRGLLNAALAVVVVGSLVTTAAVIAYPPQPATYTELAVLTENDRGDLVASGYPEELTPGTGVPLVLSVENHGDAARTYTVVALVQRVEEDGTVLEQSRVGTYTETVGAGATWREPHEISTGFVGERLRLVYLLYEGEPPAAPSKSNADLSVHLWFSSGDAS